MANEEKKLQTGVGAGEVSPEQREIEELNLTIKSMADSIEGMEERLKGQYGTDLTAAQEEIDEKHNKLEARLTAAIEKNSQPKGASTEPDDYAGYGEDGMPDFLADVVASSRTGTRPAERLVNLQKRQLEVRRLDTLSGSDGGWLMPEKWNLNIMRLPDTGDYLKRLCRMIPAGSPPNAEIKMLSLDQTGSKGIHGGVAVYSAKEAADVTVTSTPKMKFVSLKPEKIGAYWQVTDELRANAEAMAGVMGSLVQGAIAAFEDDKIQTGTGAGEYLGFDGCDAEISVSRATSNEINYVDLVNMLARILTRGNYVWLCQRVGILPQLMTMTNGAGQLIWSDNARDGIPAPRLAGVPIFFNEISPALGSAGDLRLVNLDYYLIKPGMGAAIKSDNTYGNFLSGIETLKVTYYSDGKPWLTSPLTLRDGTNTVSPFVSLAA